MRTVNFTVKAPHQVHGTDIDVRETGSWCFAYTAFDTVVWGWIVSSGTKTKHLPLTSTGTKYLLDACHHGDTLGLIHHLEHTGFN